MSVTYGSGVVVGEGLVCTLPHEPPAVDGRVEAALDYLVVQLLQVLAELVKANIETTSSICICDVKTNIAAHENETSSICIM